MSRKTIIINNTLEFLVALFLILEVNSIFFKIYDANLFISEIGCVFISLLFVANVNSINKRELIMILLYEAYVVIYAIFSVGSEGVVPFAVKFLIMIPIMVMLYFHSFETAVRVIKRISSIMVFLAWTSVVMYLASYYIAPLGKVTIEWGSIHEIGNYLFFFNVQEQELLGRQVLRNTGIFCEAPMYGFCLVMAMSTQLFYYCKIKTRNIIALSAAIVTTISATAFMLMVVLFVIKFYYGDLVGELQKDVSIYCERRKGWTKYALTAVGVVFGVVVLLYLYNFKINTGLSYMKRLDDYIAGYHAWRSRPFWGIGYDQGDQIIQYMADWRRRYLTVGYSNAVMIILSTMGIYGSLIYIYGFIRGIHKNYFTRRYISLQFIVLFVLLFTTVVPMQLYVLNYVALGIASNDHFQGRING